jgi:HAD superfamily hydrolase (TIGR01509 family)
MSTLAALIFDVDGTLCETEEVHRIAFNDTFRSAGLDWFWSVDDYARLLRVTGGKERMAAYRAERGDGPSDGVIATLHREKTARYTALVAGGGLVARPGILTLVAEARAAGLRLAVATTTSPANVEALCMAIWGQTASAMFDVIAAGDEVAAKKPAPDVYDLALKRLGLPASAALAFEDSRNGVLSAHAAGLRVVAAPSLYTAADDLTAATHLCADLSDFDLAAAIAITG